MEAAWRTAGEVLAVEVVPRFVLKSQNRSHCCVALLPDFGGKRGQLVRVLDDSDSKAEESLFAADAEREGYTWSLINGATYSVFDEDVFREALADWGFSGPESRRPTWLAQF